MNVERCTENALWDAFNARSPHGSIFCDSALLAALGVDYDRWLLRSGERIAAAALVFVRDGVPQPPIYPYQGVLLADWGIAQAPHRRAKWELETIAALVDGLAQQYDRLHLSLHHQFADLRAFQWFNYDTPASGVFDFELRYTGILTLAGLADKDAMLAQSRYVRRSDYNRALRAGLVFELCDDASVLHELLRMTLDRQQIDYDDAYPDAVRAIPAAALRLGFGEVGVCRAPGGEPASACLFLYDDQAAYYAMAGSDPAFRSTGANTLLVAEMTARAIARKLERVDFVGINSPNRGDFKTSFNAVPAPYFNLRWTRNGG